MRGILDADRATVCDPVGEFQDILLISAPIEYDVPNGGPLSGRPYHKPMFLTSKTRFALAGTALTDRHSMVFPDSSKMKITGPCLLAILACSCHQATDGSVSIHRRDELSRIMDEYLQSGDPYHKNGTCDFQFRGPLTVEQVEGELLKIYDRMRRDRSNLPSGSMPRDWTELKGKYRDGDELYACFAREKYGVSQSYWYVLVREDAIIAFVGVWTN